MPQVEITIGGRAFDVACQEGEESYLRTAADMLDEEASHLASQTGRLPESRMLLMAGLMLADRTAGLQDKVNEAESRMAQLQAQIDELELRPARTVEVPVVPAEVTETLAEIAARAEALAEDVERKAS